MNMRGLRLRGMKLFEDGGVSARLVQAFVTGYPNLKLVVSWREKARPVGVWTATVRSKDGVMVSVGVRHHQALAVGQALAGIPERYRREARG